jgi:uncharacterized protein (DUF1778 family)
MRKTERLDLRVTPAQKEVIREAAEFAGSTVAGFAIASTMSAARQAVAEARTLMIEPAAWEAFTAALDAPPDPTWENFLSERPVWST